MSDLMIGNHLIDAPMGTILNQLRHELTNGKLAQVEDKGDNFRVTCPSHKGGMESNGDCYIYCGNSKDMEYGTCHCFACGFSGPLYHFVGECFDRDDNFGRKWLIDRFGDTIVESTLRLPDFQLLPPACAKGDAVLHENGTQAPDESQLDSYQSWHPYMAQRRLSRDVCERFKVRYDPKGEHIVFPCWDERGRLVMCTRRSVHTKQFLIPRDVEKPVYLLNVIERNGINEATICESQINCLTLWGWGIPSCALFGTGTRHQYDILNRSGIRHYYLCLDGDEAGDRGIRRFLSNIRRDVFVDIILMERGKDVNDLTQEEFDRLPIIDRAEWLRRNGIDGKREQI